MRNRRIWMAGRPMEGGPARRRRWPWMGEMQAHLDPRAPWMRAQAAVRLPAVAGLARRWR
ncbi:hypothetical protein BCR44DRAFT_1443001 [Catenaria anguillulae PL171]|uniref:Uncharacterized protein n=1 Tax=Catenaria anguillulae PL171 TaxID=765915 RepID=A0A1Y2HBP2_9FUNG|nr:hypothetical protein BCR44DRAFT_1443001 [Catenaria anguillulae PL171]